MNKTTDDAALVRHNGGQRRPQGILAQYADERGMDPQELYRTLAKTIFPNERSATPEQVNALLLVAHAHGLNPWTKEIYAFPAKGGGVVPIVGVDGWYKLVNGHPDCNGMQVTVEFKDGAPFSATCRLYRKSWEHPVEVTEYLSEVKRNTDPWRQQPVRMLRHRAICQAARIAFGFSGIYEPDEAARFADGVPDEYREPREVSHDPLDDTLTPIEAPKPAPKEEPKYLPDERVQKMIRAFTDMGVDYSEVLDRMGDPEKVTVERYREMEGWYKELRAARDSHQGPDEEEYLRPEPSNLYGAPEDAPEYD